MLKRPWKWGSSEAEPPTSMTKVKHFQCGIKVLKGPKSAIVDIVFIHGLTGDREKTWTGKGASTSWPEALLPHKIPQARILSFGYDAYVTDWQAVVSKNRIRDHAKTFLRDLANYRHLDDTNERPIIFVAHSLGGLVCEDTLLASNNSAEERERRILECTRGIAFMGTPHSGAGLAHWAEVLAKSIGVFKQMNTEMLKVLQADSEVLARIQQDFHTMIRARNKQGKEEISITCFYEELPLQVIGETVVPEHSAILREYASIGIHNNHMSMTKFESEDDQGFVRVAGELQVWVKDMKEYAGYLAKKIESTIDSMNLDELLQMLSVVDQDKYKSKIPSLNRNQPSFYWVLKNMDFIQWSSATCYQVLWLSGPPKCSIRQVSSHVVDMEKERTSKEQHSILYFFCSTAYTEKPIVVNFIHTLLYQIIFCSSSDEKVQIIKTFLHSLGKAILRKEQALYPKSWRFREDDSRNTTIRKVLDIGTKELWSALRTVLENARIRELSIVIDGLDKVEHKKVEFVKEVRAFIVHLQERSLKVKALLTSRPDVEIKEVLDGLLGIEYDRERKGLLGIEYDKERKECLASLHFDNTRYSKISKEYKGSLKWLWTHEQYKEWSASSSSRLLYIQGKPGSGKSTLTKYFKDNLSKREPNAKSAIVANFFYSYREGELQISHHNMLQSILYDILDQNESFFYHFQPEYRIHQKLLQGRLVKWTYKSLKKVLLSLKDHQQAERLYLIIDAMDESSDEERRDILQLLFDLCSTSKSCAIKIFVASRPVSELQHNINKCHNLIRLQDETISDIEKFAHSFLGPDLGLTGDLLYQATTYIVKQAQGVFLWVFLVREELRPLVERGHRKREIFEQLTKLPTELEDFYERILQKIRGGPSKDTQDGTRMFQLALFARRPLTVAEFQHALAIENDPKVEFVPSDESFEGELIQGIEKRIIHCGGNGSVQVMHQTVREFFLRPKGCAARSKFEIGDRDAHVSISITCIRYLILCAANTDLEDELPNIKSWTMEHFERYAQYLDRRPLANYALDHLKHHLDNCHHVESLLHLVPQFLDRLTDNIAVYLLESWVTSHLKEAIRDHELGETAEDFRNKTLHAAARKRLPRVAEALLSVGARVEALLQGETPLIVSAKKGDDATVRLLVNKGADVNANDGGLGRAALHWAAQNGHEVVVQLLLEKGADIDARDKDGWTALHGAARNRHEAVTQLLLERGADIGATDKSGWTALHVAAQWGYEAIVKLLVEKGGHIHAGDRHGKMMIHWAAGNGHKEVVQLLVEKGVDVGVKERGLKETALHRAAENGHEAVASLLVGKGANVNENESVFGQTALHRAAENGHEAAAQLLIKKGADVNAETGSGWTALHQAALYGHEEVVQLLVDKGANINAEGGLGQTAVHRAACGGQEAVVRLLAENGASVNAIDKGFGQTALHLAAAYGREGVARLLIERGVDVHAKDVDGKTALHRAACNEQKAMIRLLVEKGA